IITGLKPTGAGLHIGNYFGAFQPFLQQAQGNEAYIFLADYHSLTSVHDAEDLKNFKKRMLIEYFSLIPDNANITVFEQSKVNHINDINWIISSMTPYSLMLRAHTFKDTQAKNQDINMATFNYPILMSADILAYDIELVPVGKDQKQHLEFARDIAGYFNRNYKTEIFTLPEAYIVPELQTIPGTDGRKMSKSYNNHIGIFDTEKQIKKKIMSIETGSETLEEPKDPENCNVFALIKLFADEAKQQEIAEKYKAGNYGYGHAKLELLDLFLKYFQTQREKYQKYSEDFSLIEEKLKTGNTIANNLATKKYNDLMEVVGL
ncbi:tryptophan--tRNA ligase, partial [Candidatus Gracilibacteria bacterium]|nr:tryptophan--tRNA ligase [Candidatus Gracilibacteria bacterium]